MSADSAHATPPFFTRYGFARIPGELGLVIEPYPEICLQGSLRATIVASAIDLVGGFHTREVAGTDATFTSDLSLRIPVPSCPRRIDVRGELLRSGKRLVTTDVTLHSEAGVYAYGTTTFARIPRAPEKAPDLETLSTPLVIESHPLTRSLAEEVGLEAIDSATGALRIALRPALLNPEGVMQGALVALVVECAALAFADAHTSQVAASRRGHVVSDLDLRYLAASSVGPVESRARWIGTPEQNTIRVELRDAGRGDRLTALALVRVTEPIP